MAPVRTAAVLLRSHEYGDSSRILRFYTADHGLLSVVAHGLRGRSGKGGGGVSSFATGELTAHVKAHRDLHTMSDFACRRARDGLGRSVLRFAGAAAVAELVLAHAAEAAHTEVFSALEGALDRLDSVEDDSVAAAVLAGLWTVTDALGFAPQLDTCVRCGTPLTEDGVGRFDLPAGGIRCAACAEGGAGPRIGPIARGQLGDLLHGELPPGLTHGRQHLSLVADFVEYHVVPRPLKAFKMLGGLLTDDAAPV